MTRTTVTLATLAIAMAAAAPPAHAAPDQQNTPLLLVPAELELAAPTPGAELRRSVWIVNTSSTPVELLAARGTCGCTTVAFKPQALPPRASLEVPLRIRAPKTPGVAKSVQVTFAAEGLPPLKLPVRIQSEGIPAAPRPGIVAEPAQVDLGPVIAGELITASARLVNTGSEPRTVTAARTSCGCTRVIDFAPFTLPPGEAFDVPIEVDAPARVGRPFTKEITFIVEEQAPLKVPVRMIAGHPDVDAARQRVDALLNDAYELDDFAVEEGSITAIAWNTRREPEGRVTMTLAEDGRLTSLRFDAFTTMARDAT